MDERTQEALRHLQRATLEFIDAARARPDLAEDLVREPGGLVRIVAETVAGVSQAAGTCAAAAGVEGGGSARRRRTRRRRGAAIRVPAWSASRSTDGRTPRPNAEAERRGERHGATERSL